MDSSEFWREVIVLGAVTATIGALALVMWICTRGLFLEFFSWVKRAGVGATIFWCVFTLGMVRCGAVTRADKNARLGMQHGPNTTGIPAIHEISPDDYALGAVLSEVLLDETHDFTPPSDAVIFDDWCRFGAECDWFRLDFAEDRRLPFANTNLSALTIYSQGLVRPSARSNGCCISPLWTSSGFAPASVLLRGDDCVPACRFWHRQSEVGSLILTWENALLGRDALGPVSFQVELFANGDIIFRYDLSRIGSTILTGVQAGLVHEGVGRMLTEISTRVTTLKWTRLDPSWVDVADPDGDGASTSDEVFVLGTDPANADSDGDGILDGLDPYPTEPDADGDGIADGISLENYLSHPLWGGQDGYGTGVDIFLNSPVVPPAKAVLRVGSLPIVLTTNAVYRIKIEDGVRYDIRLTTNRMAPVNLSLGRDGE